jgi:glycosyltransferase involved in cell wall biosynthesis
VTDLQLVLAGQGSAAPAVRARIAASGLPPERVAVLGALSEEELRLAYRGAAAVVLASRLEGFGLPALEAMASGVPVVAAEAGALPEVTGDASLLFPVDSVACLLSALYRSIPGSDPRVRRERIRRGLVRAREFSWDRTARETHAAYGVALHRRT